MKILDFFLFLWVIFALPDPDPATQIIADPKPCYTVSIFVHVTCQRFPDFSDARLPFHADTSSISDPAF
jgi:hypothetical protein